MSRLTHAALSDRGRSHVGNEDRWLADPDQGLYVVSDGMADDVAPQIVVDELPGLLRRHLAGITDLAVPEAAAGIRAALAELSDDVREEGRRCRGDLGATVVLVLTREDQALVAHL